MPSVIGYAYDADTYCAYCTVERFGDNGHGEPPEEARDSEGNSIHPILSTDDGACQYDDGVSSCETACVECSRTITWHEHCPCCGARGYECPCNDGECNVCSEEPEDEDEPDDLCLCDNCVAADEYVRMTNVRSSVLADNADLDAVAATLPMVDDDEPTGSPLDWQDGETLGEYIERMHDLDAGTLLNGRPPCTECGRAWNDNEHAIFGGSPTFHGYHEPER